MCLKAGVWREVCSDGWVEVGTLVVELCRSWFGGIGMTVKLMIN